MRQRHRAGHDGARRLQPRDTPAPVTVLERRGRGTGRRTAADIVVHPRSVVTAPVTGTVVAATPYVLYCVHRDQLVFIAPDERPEGMVVALGEPATRAAGTLFFTRNPGRSRSGYRM